MAILWESVAVRGSPGLITFYLAFLLSLPEPIEGAARAANGAGRGARPAASAGRAPAR